MSDRGALTYPEAWSTQASRRYNGDLIDIMSEWGHRFGNEGVEWHWEATMDTWAGETHPNQWSALPARPCPDSGEGHVVMCCA